VADATAALPLPLRAAARRGTPLDSEARPLSEGQPAGALGPSSAGTPAPGVARRLTARGLEWLSAEASMRHPWRRRALPAELERRTQWGSSRFFEHTQLDCKVAPSAQTMPMGSGPIVKPLA
jgi:hypothetical protein